ncbi:PREDICTED: auxin response factor 17-like [Fragaria vesca subsp. vesca]
MPNLDNHIINENENVNLNVNINTTPESGTHNVVQPNSQIPYSLGGSEGLARGFKPRQSPRLAAKSGTSTQNSENDDKVVSFAKILTPSEANNGGGFSVPRFCADSIFPPLNYQAEPPVQTLSVTDLHGVVWDFRHIYRGTPRRHLLTTGWSKFVNSKMLVAGDSVVFMRSSRGGEMYVGVRRTVRASPGGYCSRWSLTLA